jgi:hypothetical protein
MGDMPKAPMGHVFGGNPNSRGEDFYGHVNVTPPRYVDERGTEWLNVKEASSRRGQARDSGASSNRKEP